MRTKLLISVAAALVVLSAAAGPVIAQGQTVKSTNPEAEAMGPAPTDAGDWIRVGFDYNNDGYIDRFEYLHRRDLDTARQRSVERRSAAGMPARDRMGYYPDQRGMRDSARESAVSSSVTGMVEDLKRIGLVGAEDEHQLAKIRTADGRIARVDLGPVVNLRGLDLRQGDTITVHGGRGTINDKQMLMAHRIEAGGRTISVGWPNDRHLSRYSGEVIGVRTAPFRNTNVPEQVFARVLLDQGGVTTVNLGPMDMLRKVSPEELRGKRISFLAHPAKIGNRVALVAEELRVDGRSVQVDWTMAGASGRGVP